MKIIFPLLFIIISHANADCTPKDLTDPAYLTSIGKENLIDHFKTPRDQDSVGWCGAYSSGDALSFAVGEPISPIDISVNYYANDERLRETNLDKLRGINVLAATDLARNHGYCPEAVIPSNQTSTSNLGNAAVLKLMQSFREIYDDYVAKGRPDDYCVDCIKKYEDVIKPSLPAVTSEMIESVLKKNQNDSATAFKDLLDKLCEGRRIKVNPQVDLISKNQLGIKNLAAEIDKALDNNSMPSIVINTSFFADPKAIPSGNGDHGMIIVAKRQDQNGKCEYLVRNSWGRGCSFYQPQVKAKCDPANGTFWMDQNEVQAGVAHIVVIKNEKNRAVPSLKQTIFGNNSNSRSNTGSFFDRFRNNIPSRSTVNDNYNNFVKTSKEKAGASAVIIKDKTSKTATKVKSSFSSLISSIWKSLTNAFKY